MEASSKHLWHVLAAGRHAVSHTALLLADRRSGPTPCPHVSRQRLSGSNHSLGASVPHSGNPHTASDFVLVTVPVIRGCDGAPVAVLCAAN